MGFKIEMDKAGAKSLAAALNKRLKELGINISHAQTYEVVAAVNGDPSWNVTAAALTSKEIQGTPSYSADGVVPVVWWDVEEARETLESRFPDITTEETAELLRAFVSHSWPTLPKGHWNHHGHEDVYRENMTDIWIEEVFLPGHMGEESETLTELRNRVGSRHAM